MSARIIRVDSINIAVQELKDIETTVKGVRTGDTRREWVDAGYYGHRLEWAAESALFQSMKIGEEITKETIKEAVKQIVNETKELFKEKK